MFISAKIVASIVVAWLLVCQSAALAQQAAAGDPIARSAVDLGPERQYSKPVASWRELKSMNVVMQQREYTCGAASLATLLKYCFDRKITEQKVLDAALAKLTERELQDRQENGLSMEDLANGASRLKFAAAVLELKYEKLRTLKSPVIVRLLRDDFKHFVVFRGERGGRVFLADPLRGNIRMPVSRFLDEWDGKILAVVLPGRKLDENGPLAVPPWQIVTPENEAARRSVVGAPFPPTWIVTP